MLWQDIASLFTQCPFISMLQRRISFKTADLDFKIHVHCNTQILVEKPWLFRQNKSTPTPLLFFPTSRHQIALNFHVALHSHDRPEDTIYKQHSIYFASRKKARLRRISSFSLKNAFSNIKARLKYIYIEVLRNHFQPEWYRKPRFWLPIWVWGGIWFDGKNLTLCST